MKSSNFLIVCLIFLSSSIPLKYPLVVSKWISGPDEEKGIHRKLASMPKGQCMKGLFSVTTLKEEVQELERPYLVVEKVRGTWGHINLETLPVPQANFLKTYGNQIGDISDPASIDYSACSDLPCVFNKIYGKDEHVAGYVHYIWYLKFGHMLALDNHVPKQASDRAGEYNSKKIPLSSYLFSEKELYGMWRLSHMLKTPHNSITGMRQIQRVPRGELFEESEYRKACGLAGNGGWIRLTDRCLVLSKDGDKGDFYHFMVHELSHQIDYEEGRRLYQASHRSHQKDYLNISGFYLQEYKDERGLIQRNWKRKDEIKLPTSYSGLNPQENFAEAMAYLRIKGDSEKKKKYMTAEHIEFISNNYYQGRHFDKASLFKFWIVEHGAQVARQAIKALIDCGSNRKCLKNKKDDIENEFKSTLMIKEAEGCSLFKNWFVSRKWKKEIRRHIDTVFENHQLESSLSSSYLAELKELDRDYSGQEIALDSYVQCLEDANEKSCYTSEVEQRFNGERMGQIYLSYYPYAEIRHRINEGYRTLVASQQELLHNTVRRVWQSCKRDEPVDSEVPTGSFFHLSDGYMVSSMYNCLNVELPSALKMILDQMKVKRPEEEMIIASLLKSQMNKAVQDIYERERALELKEAKESRGPYSFHLKKEIISN